MSKPWTIADHVDFELLLGQEEQSPQASERLSQRDRKFFLEKFNAQRSLKKGAVFLGWLEHRRTERFGKQVTPGQELQSLLSSIWWGLLIAGLLAARFVVWSFFRGSEISGPHPEPINVLWYAVICVGLPFGLSLLLFWTQISGGRLPTIQPPTLLRGSLLRVLNRLLRRGTSKAEEHVPHETRWKADVIAGVLRAMIREQKNALSAELFSTVQAFGLAFTVGVVLFSWIDCKFYSRVFGWQSTDTSITTELVHQKIRAIALPWSWLAKEGNGFPTLDQVRQTRFVRYHELTGFPVDAAATWAKFLIAAALVYGFIPRLILYTLSRLQARRSLKNTDFGILRYDQLWGRFTNPHVAIDAPSGGIPEPIQPFSPGSDERARQTVPCLLILLAELNQDRMAAHITQRLAQIKNFSVRGETIEIDANLSASDVHSRIEDFEWGDTHARIVAVQEAFMPPNVETLKLLKEISCLPQRKVSVYVGLVGKPGKAPLGRLPKKLDVDVWHEKVQSLGKPNLEVFSLTNPA